MIISFYCKSCDLDQDLSAHTGCHTFTGEFVAWYEAECKRCGKNLRRHITEKQSDPYFRQSKKLRMQREQMKKDLLQYGEDGFKTLYKKSWDTFQHNEEMLYNKGKREKETRDELYKNFGWDLNKRQILNKIYSNG